MAAEDGDDQRGVKPTDKKKCSKWWWFVVMFDTEAQALAWAPHDAAVQLRLLAPARCPLDGQAPCPLPDEL